MRWILGISLILGGFSSLYAGATLQGKVNFSSHEVKKRKPSRYSRGAAEQTSAPQEPRAVIYIEGDFPESAFPPQDKPIELGQRDLDFESSVLPIVLGSKVVFPNYDETYHNVFSYSKTKTFDLGRYSKDEEPQAVEFTKPGVVKIFCEIHDNMRATILVLDTPYFTVTGTGGAYSLPNLPAGEYTVKCWFSARRVLSQKVVLVEGEVNHLDFAK